MVSQDTLSARNFAKAAWLFLAYNLLVIAWGALVRATGSGAGCGNHWPLCNGVWMPEHPALKTLIELTHRAMSGIALMGVILLHLWSRRLFAKKSLPRRAALAGVCLMLSEAVIGAGLVLLKLVAQDTSLLRAGYLSVHLLNTFMLLAALTVTAWASHHENLAWGSLRDFPNIYALSAALACTLIVGITGGIAALGDTLFPTHSLQEGFARDFSPGVHFLVRLRVLHPVLAILLILILSFLALRATTHESPNLRTWAKATLVMVTLQLFVGGLNLLWLAPVPLQLIHLMMADILWVVLILFSLSHIPV